MEYTQKKPEIVAIQDWLDKQHDKPLEHTLLGLELKISEIRRKVYGQ